MFLRSGSALDRWCCFVSLSSFSFYFISFFRSSCLGLGAGLHLFHFFSLLFLGHARWGFQFLSFGQWKAFFEIGKGFTHLMAFRSKSIFIFA